MTREKVGNKFKFFNPPIQTEKTALKLFKGKCRKCGKKAESIWRGRVNSKNEFIKIKCLAFNCPHCGFGKSTMKMGEN